MNLKMLKATIEELKEDLGPALLSTDIWSSSDGQSIVGYKPRPKVIDTFEESLAS